MKEFFEQIKEKIEDIKNSPGTIFGIIYPYILIVGVVMGLYYLANVENISRQKVPAVIPDSTVVADLQIKESRIVPPISISEISESTPELLSEGEKLYKANCSSCHGDNGVGGGPASAGLNPAPRNFTNKDNWKIGTKLSQIYTTLQEGIQGGAMASYDYLLPREKFALAHYLRQNFIPDPPLDSQSDLEALDATYNLSAGLQMPAQIPVKEALNIILSESEKSYGQIISAYNKVMIDPAADLFNTVTSNGKKALIFLVNNQSWRQSENNFIDLIVNNVNSNGFSGKVFNLSSDEWNKLYNLLLRNV